jgi:hypothetical protein
MKNAKKEYMRYKVSVASDSENVSWCRTQSSEPSNEYSGSIKGGVFLVYLSHCLFLSKNCRITGLCELR